MTLTIILALCLASIAIAWLHHRVRRAQPRSRIELLPRCECGECARTRAAARSAR